MLFVNILLLLNISGETKLWWPSKWTRRKKIREREQWQVAVAALAYVICKALPASTHKKTGW